MLKTIEIVLTSSDSSNYSFDKPTFQILKRPQGCDMQSSSSQHDMAKLEEKTRTMTLQVKIWLVLEFFSDARKPEPYLVHWLN